jgi:hypothetical protein
MNTLAFVRTGEYLGSEPKPPLPDRYHAANASITTTVNSANPATIGGTRSVSDAHARDNATCFARAFVSSVPG